MTSSNVFKKSGYFVSGLILGGLCVYGLLMWRDAQVIKVPTRVTQILSKDVSNYYYERNMILKIKQADLVITTLDKQILHLQPNPMPGRPGMPGFRPGSGPMQNRPGFGGPPRMQPGPARP